MSEEGFLSFPFFWKRPIWGLSMKWGLPIQVRQQTSKESPSIQINFIGFLFRLDLIALTFMFDSAYYFNRTQLDHIGPTSKNYSYIELDEIQLQLLQVGYLHLNYRAFHRLGKLNFLMVVQFQPKANFQY